MAREHAPIRLDIWSDDEFRNLTPSAQHLYFVMVTSPSLSYAGVVDWRPGRIGALANSWGKDGVEKAAKELAQHLFIIVDEDTEEAMIRSFVKHDGLMKNPKIAISMAMAFASIASKSLRSVFVYELVKLKQNNPELKGWSEAKVTAILSRDAIDPSTYPSGYPLTYPLDLPLNSEIQGERLGVDLGEGSLPAPTPAPTPTTSYEVVQQSAKDAHEVNTTPSAVPPTHAQRQRTDGWAEVRAIIPTNYPQAMKTALALECSKLRIDGTSHEDVCAGLRKWKAKDKAGPGLLPFLVTDAIKERENAANPQSNLAKGDQKVFGWDTELQKLKTGNNNGMRELN